MSPLSLATVATLALRSLSSLDPAVSVSNPPLAPLDAAGMVGVTPEAIACAGGTAGSVVQIESQLVEASGLIGELWSAVEADDAAVGSYREIALRSWAEPSHPDDVQIVSGVAAAHAAAEAARANVRTAAVASLPDAPRAALLRHIANAHWRVPTEFKVLEGDVAFWSDVQSAIIAERRAQRLGLPLAAEHASLLSSIRSDPAVQLAKAGLDANLAAISAAFVETDVVGGDE